MVSGYRKMKARGKEARGVKWRDKWHGTWDEGRQQEEGRALASGACQEKSVGPVRDLDMKQNKAQKASHQAQLLLHLLEWQFD